MCPLRRVSPLPFAAAGLKTPVPVPGSEQTWVVIGTVAANAPYIGLLGTVLGIMLTFHTMGSSGTMAVQTIMVGLSLALKATAVGLLVAIPCVVLNNILRRRVTELLTQFKVHHGA